MRTGGYRKPAVLLFTAAFLVSTVEVNADAAGTDAAEPVHSAAPRLITSVRPVRPIAGEEITVEIAVRGGRNVGSVSFHLLYEPSLLEPVEGGATEGGWLRRDGSRTSFLSRHASTDGRIIVGASRLGAPRGAQGGGVVCRLRFRALTAGSGALVFDRVHLGDPLANDLTVRPLTTRFTIGERKGR